MWQSQLPLPHRWPQARPLFLSQPLLRQRADAITAAQVPRPNPAGPSKCDRLCAGAGGAGSDQPNQSRTAPPGRAAGRGLSMNELAQFLGYVTKVFGFGRVVRSVRCRRPYPTIPTRCLFLSLFLGVVVRAGSYLDISKQTKRRRWQHLIHWGQRISDDAFHYVSERFYLEDLRQALAEVNKRLKANKALESCKINGLLFVSLDANEHFHSRSRCCPCCCQREIQEVDAQGQKQTVIEYYHRYVFAQINGPKFNVLLDLEPIRPGEGEAEAALRLLCRIRRGYGARVFVGRTKYGWDGRRTLFKAKGENVCGRRVVLTNERM